MERGEGSVLRGWRRVVDPDGQSSVSFPMFCKAAVELGYEGDVLQLLDLKDPPKQCELMDISPEEGQLLTEFRAFIKEAFEGPMSMFDIWDFDGKGYLTMQKFEKGCNDFGFEATQRELEELYRCCDFNSNGVIKQEEIIFLEQDPDVREMEVFKAKRNKRDQHMRHMAHAYAEDLSRNLPAKHRLAQRPWLDHHYARLPTLVRYHDIQFQKKLYGRRVESQIIFLRHLRIIYGNEVRGWRRGLDPKNTFEVNTQMIKRYCRAVDLPLDVGALCHSLDRDGDGTLSLEELAPQAADVMATFKKWANDEAGSCAVLWDLKESHEVRKATAQHKKMRYSAFYELLEVLGCPIAGNIPGRKLLAQSLDLPGCGFVSKLDLQWLDEWYPPEWLCEEPDYEAWEHFRARIQRLYPHPLAAWRKLLDVDSSNSVSWVEFTEAAGRVGYRGNVAGAWRALDHDLSGTITMKEYDAGSAVLLESFKEWAEANFGSVRHAFKAMDDDGNSLVGFTEMKRACQRLHWHGDARLLFDCLDVDGKLDGGKRFLSIREVIFLDSWSSDMCNTYAIKKAMMDSVMVQCASPMPSSPSESVSSSMFRSSSAPTLPRLDSGGGGGGVDSPGMVGLSPGSTMRDYQSQSAFKTPKKQRRMKKQWYHKIMSPDGALPAYSGL